MRGVCFSVVCCVCVCVSNLFFLFLAVSKHCENDITLICSIIRVLIRCVLYIERRTSALWFYG